MKTWHVGLITKAAFADVMRPESAEYVYLACTAHSRHSRFAGLGIDFGLSASSQLLRICPQAWIRALQCLPFVNLLAELNFELLRLLLI